MRRIFFSTFITLAAVWGVIAAGIAVYQISGSAIFGAGVIVSTFAGGFLASSASLLSYINSIRSGYRPYRTPSFITRRTSRIDVNERFEATAKTSRDLVFLEEPTPEDLVDMVDTLKGFALSQAAVNSADSSVGGRTSIKPNVMALQWMPKKPIIPLVPYRHRRVISLPDPYGPVFFYHSTYCDREVGIASHELHVPRPLEEVTAFIMPLLRRHVSERVLDRYGLRSRRKQCPQPILSSDGRTITWTLRRPTRGRIYVIFGIYAGKREAFDRMVRDKSVFRGFWAKLQSIRSILAKEI